MISYRLKGLISFHKLVVIFIGTAWFWVFADIVRTVPGGLDLHPNVFVPVYLLAVAAAMVASLRYLNVMAPDYHRFTWIHSAQLTVRQVLTAALFIFGMTFARKDQVVSRLFVGNYLLTLSAMLLFANAGLPRLLARLAFHRDHHLPTLFIGSQRTLGHLGEWLAGKRSLGLRAMGFLSDEAPALEKSAPEFPFLGPIGDLRRVIERHLIAQVILLDIPRHSAEIARIIETCQDAGCRVLIYSNLPEMVGHPLTAVTEGGHQFYALQDEPLENPLNRTIKRVFDVAIALPIVVVLLPPLALGVWVMQRIQAPGPLLYRQKRSGKSGGAFEILKFRSMYDNKRDPTAEARQARRGDERIYPFGRFLRQCSLDEFPQFINVLRGDMSIVGPRPHLLAHDKQFSEHKRGYRTRFIVKPGITGLAQSRGFRGEITDPKLLELRVENDLEYISSWSIWLDIQIVVKTAWQLVFPPKTAH